MASKKIGVVIPIYNRPEYLKQCFYSLEKAIQPDIYVLVDDCSNNSEVDDLVWSFQDRTRAKVIIVHNGKNEGIKETLKLGIAIAFEEDCHTVLNLDSDAIVSPDWINHILAVRKRFPSHIITGFHSTTKNRDGSERHKIFKEGREWAMKKSVGGINMCFTQKQYKDYILPTLNYVHGNWDHITSIHCGNMRKHIVCTVPSVIEHIGIVSSLGHSGDVPDTADSFTLLNLPNVTLIGVDSQNLPGLKRAFEISQKHIKVGAAKIIETGKTLADINSKEDYSKFCMKRMHLYVNTEFALIIQADGYILNAAAWTNEFLNYDYVGATWTYKDGKNVGNGGFSLRSRRLLEILATDPHINDLHPEDDKISRKYRPYLESKYGIKFAPEHLANRFSIEAYGTLLPGSNKYSGQFGFHGYDVDFRNSGLPDSVLPVKRR